MSRIGDDFSALLIFFTANSRIDTNYFHFAHCFFYTFRNIRAFEIGRFAPEFDIEQLEINLVSFDKICSGKKDGGPIASFDIAERFRWLTAIKSSSIQTSRPHSGFSTDLDKTFDKLYAELVL